MFMLQQKKYVEFLSLSLSAGFIWSLCVVCDEQKNSKSINSFNEGRNTTSSLHKSHMNVPDIHSINQVMSAITILRRLRTQGRPNRNSKDALSFTTLWGSSLFRFTPPQGSPCRWLTENTSYWTTQTGPQAPTTYTTNKTTHTHAHTRAHMRVHLVDDEVEQRGTTWRLKRTSNSFSRRIKVSRSDNNNALCSFGTGDVPRGDGQTIKTTESKVEKELSGCERHHLTVQQVEIIFICRFFRRICL